MKIKITILALYQTQISIHSISLTQQISDIKLVRGRCREIAKKTRNKMFLKQTNTEIYFSMPKINYQSVESQYCHENM